MVSLKKYFVYQKYITKKFFVYRFYKNKRESDKKAINIKIILEYKNENY